MNLHDLFTLLNIPMGTSGHDMTQTLPKINIKVQYIRYTSEYIPKLQLHQHSLLTRKVFSRHNLSAQVFFSVSSGSSSSHLRLQVVFIVKSSSSSLDHHLVLSITGSSLDHHHHNCFRYLNQIVLSQHSSRHSKFYRANPFSCWL